MKIINLGVAVLAGLLVAGSTSVFAQQKGEGQGPGAERTGQSSQERQQERVQDRERISDPDRLMMDQQDRDRDQTRDRDQLKDQDQDQDRDRDRIHQDEVYGSELMTEGEMTRYQAQMQNAASEQERQMIQARHREEMQVRAREKGVALEEPVE
ncbi:MAG: hypothetical protein ACNA8G_10285 [Gammaproteobacteria bacterium]